MSDERARWRAAGIAVLGFAILAFVIGFNPANLPESWIERWLQQELPYGSSIVAVRQTIEDEEWKTVNDWVADTGSLVLVDMGTSWVPQRRVSVYFSFDVFGRLIHIDVQKRPVNDRRIR